MSEFEQLIPAHALEDCPATEPATGARCVYAHGHPGGHVYGLTIDPHTPVDVPGVGTIDAGPSFTVQAEWPTRPRRNVDADPALPDPGRELEGRRHRQAADTERAAAARATPKRGTQRARVLEAFQKWSNTGDRWVGPPAFVFGRGFTDYELARHIGAVRPHVAGTRREELIRDGWPIRDTGHRRPTDTGSPAIVWALDDGTADA